MYKLEIAADLMFDATGKPVISNCVCQIKGLEAKATSVSHKLVRTETVYGILTFGAKSPVTHYLSADTEITVKYAGKEYLARVHKTIKGRLDGLTSLIQSDKDKFQTGNTIVCAFDPASAVLTIV